MLLQVPPLSLRRIESFGSVKFPRVNSGKGSLQSLLPSNSFPVETPSHTRRVYTICGFLALEIVLIVITLHYRSALTLTSLCQHKAPPVEPRYPPSAWYYEHVYDYPIPMLRILTNKEGAAPIRSKILPRDREITIATHTTADRLPAVKMTALRWSGAMALVVLVRMPSEISSVYQALQELHGVVEAEGRCRLSIQVIIEDGFKDEKDAMNALYPVNAMRNLALRMVTTELIFFVDADFVPNPGLHEHLTQQEDKYADYVHRAKEERHVLVIPAFHMIQDKSIPYRESLHALPHTKEEMREAWWNGIVDCFHCDVSPDAHSPTDYPKFTDPAVDYPYDVTYKEGYEPFFIAAVDSYPDYDPRFRGYGKNKMAHTYLLAARGIGFTVLPEGFLVELPHPPSLSERLYNQKLTVPLHQWRIDALYRRFKTEVNKELNVANISTTESGVKQESR